MIFKTPKKELNILAYLRNEFGNEQMVSVIDSKFREDALDITKELDAKSGEKYHKQVTYKNNEFLISPHTRAVHYG